MSFLADAEIVAHALDDYRQQSLSETEPVLCQPRLEELVSELGLETHVRAGGLTGDRLVEFMQKYLAATTRLHHPGYLAHQVAIPHYSGALAALVDGFTNNAMAIYEMGPGAASIEYFMINWLLAKTGWAPASLHAPPESNGPVSGGGVLTHGGSLANLTALIAARRRIAPDVWQTGNPGDLALLAPETCHYSIARAAGILGIGAHAIYSLPVAADGTIVPNRLAQAFDRLQGDGKRAVALVANACTTAVGLYDPLAEIGAFCRSHHVWFHVDGAHGASALLSSKYRSRMAGVELADSLSWDAHKLMRTPTLCTAVLVRDYRDLDRAFQQEASYLFHDKEQPGFDFIERTVECTKAGLGLRLFMTVAGLGEDGLAQYVEHQFDLTAQAYDFLRQQPDFECAVAPQANILCFRVAGSDELQLQIRDRVIARGHFYLTSALFGGQRYLRITVMNPDTSMAHIERLIGEIREIRTSVII